MAIYFFPSCKVQQQYPAQSQKLQAYLKQRFGIEPVGCCRPNMDKPGPEDTALVICNNCANMLEESSAAQRIEYVWELIDADDEFTFPDFQGEAITVQDCWLAKDRPGLHEAVRSLLRKMNFQAVELAENRENSLFCGEFLLKPCAPGTAQLAPRRYVQQYPHMFTPLPPEQHAAHYQEHCRQITTPRAACYCRNCDLAIEAGGKQAVHLLDLLFPAE